MKRLINLIISAVVVVFSTTGLLRLINYINVSGAPPYGESEQDVPEEGLFNWDNWKRPEGPPKVGLQAGHWKNEELPEELSKLIGSTGAMGGGKQEWEVNLQIAQSAAKYLQSYGVTVDILPATVPEQYWADVFVAIHADGNLDTQVSGYKAAAPWRDLTHKADSLVAELESEYSTATRLPRDPNISRNMRGYYAFSWWRYNHAIHPMTTAAIIETGFLSNKKDRTIIINQSDVAGKAIADGIYSFLKKIGVTD